MVISDKRILITGTGGFVGKNLNEALGKQYIVFSPSHTCLDLLDPLAVSYYIRENKVNCIIHCASVGGSRATGYDQNGYDICEKNLRMFFNLERCITSDMQMIHCGSGAEYSRQHWKPKMSEEYFDQYVPSDSYGYSKYLISKYIEKMKNVTCLRIFGLYGKYENCYLKFISNAIVKNLLHLPIVINQNVKFDYLFIDDFIKVVSWIIKNEPRYNQYNVTPNESVDLVHVANVINEVSDFKSEIVILNEGNNTEYTGDNKRLLAELKDFEFADFSNTIDELFRYYKKILPSIDVDLIQNDPYLRNCMIQKCD